MTSKGCKKMKTIMKYCNPNARDVLVPSLVIDVAIGDVNATASTMATSVVEVGTLNDATSILLVLLAGPLRLVAASTSHVQTPFFQLPWPLMQFFVSPLPSSLFAITSSNLLPL